MDNQTLTGALIWLGSAAGVAFVGAAVSRLLEHAKWFGQISPNGKQAVVIGCAVVVAILGKAVTEYLASNPGLSAMLEPYAQTVLTVMSYFGTQAEHGMAKLAAAKRDEERRAYVRMMRATNTSSEAG